MPAALAFCCTTFQPGGSAGLVQSRSTPCAMSCSESVSCLEGSPLALVILNFSPQPDSLANCLMSSWSWLNSAWLCANDSPTVLPLSDLSPLRHFGLLDADEPVLVLLEPLDPQPTPTVITAATISDRTAVRPADPLTISTPLLLLRRLGCQGIALRRRPVRPAGAIRTSAVCRMQAYFLRFLFGTAMRGANRNLLTTAARRERVRPKTGAALCFRS